MTRRVDELDSEKEGFLGRWSRLKQDDDPGAKTVAVTAPVPEDAVEAAKGADAAKGDAELSEEEVVAQLPDIETLDRDSDFTVFLQEKVPEALRRQALKRLWRSNPLLANLDGLNDYDEDFTDAATVIEGMKTAYQVGRGYLRDDPPDDDLAAEELAADDPAADELAADEVAAPGPADGEPSAEPSDVEEAAGEAADQDAPAKAEDGSEPEQAALPETDQSGSAALPANSAAPKPLAMTTRAAKPRGGVAARRWGGQGTDQG